jgi:hypothetical protein
MFPDFPGLLGASAFWCISSSLFSGFLVESRLALDPWLSLLRRIVPSFGFSVSCKPCPS